MGRRNHVSRFVRKGVDARHNRVWLLTGFEYGTLLFMMERDSLPTQFQLRTLTDYSDASLLDEIRRFAREFKGKRLTHEEFNKISRVHSTALLKRFGSCSGAIERAGINSDIAPGAKL